MRQAGQLAVEAEANRLVDYLLTLGIEARADHTGEAWAIWIYDENRLAESRQELAEFELRPEDPKYVAAVDEAAVKRREQEKAQRRAAKNVVNMRDRWRRPGATGRRPLTLALIGICSLIGIVTNFGEDQSTVDPYLYRVKMPTAASEAVLQQQIAQALRRGDIAAAEQAQRLLRSGDNGLQDIRNGQIWRLVTPMLVHQSFLHLLFNMFWLYSLGGLLEDRYGTWWLAWLVVVSAVISNLAQYYWVGPFFGGMSGVVYALFGYVWMKSKFDPAAGFYLDPRTIFLMLIWFVVCFTGKVGPIANAAHAGGLVVGLVLGYAPRLLRRWL